LTNHYLLDRRRHLGGQRQVAAKISGRPTSPESKLAWLEHFGPWGERLDRRYNWLPPAHFGREVARPDLQTGATGLSLPPAHTGPDASGSSGRRSRHHLVGRHDHHFAGGLEPGRNNSPIRAISNKGPGAAHAPSPGDAYCGRHLGRVTVDQLERAGNRPEFGLTKPYTCPLGAGSRSPAVGHYLNLAAPQVPTTVL
jgi:hypothetical protein